MTWLAVAASIFVLVFVLVAWPYHAWRRAPRLAVRADGSLSQKRRDVERSKRWRAVLRGAILPLALTAAVGTAGPVMHEWMRWNATQALFGTRTPETDLLARSLYESVEEQAWRAAERAARAIPEKVPIPEDTDLQEWAFQHFPLHPFWVLLLLIAVWWSCRWALVERKRYLSDVGSRMRSYQRRDLKRLGRRRADRSAAPSL